MHRSIAEVHTECLGRLRELEGRVGRREGGSKVQEEVVRNGGGSRVQEEVGRFLRTRQEELAMQQGEEKFREEEMVREEEMRRADEAWREEKVTREEEVRRAEEVWREEMKRRGGGREEVVLSASKLQPQRSRWRTLVHHITIDGTTYKQQNMEGKETRSKSAKCCRRGVSRDQSVLSGLHELFPDEDDLPTPR